MRVGFMGTPAFAVPTLDALIDAGHDVALVVAQPDKPVGRSLKLTSPPTVARARERGIPTAQPTKLKSGDFPTLWAQLGLEVGVVVAYGRILPPPLLWAPRRGCINVHASLLPRWRGAAPIQWSIVSGDEETGITTMNMAEGLDTGDILLQAPTPISPGDTAATLHDRLAPLGAALLVETLAKLDGLRPRPQPESGVTLAPVLTREHGRLDWSRPAPALDQQARGLSPWPGAFTVVRGEVLKVLRVAPIDRDAPEAPGTLLAGARVACGRGQIELVEVQLAGRRAVRGVDWMNGARVAPGEALG